MPSPPGQDQPEQELGRVFARHWTKVQCPSAMRRLQTDGTGTGTPCVLFSKEPRTMRRKWEVLLYLCLGTGLGLGIAAYRNGFGGPSAQAAMEQAGGKDKGKKEAGGVFSPPGTAETGIVTPLPGEPPFKGKIGRTMSESPPDWPPLARAPKDAP